MTFMSAVEQLVRDIVDLRVAGRQSRGNPRLRVRQVEDRMRQRVGQGVPKAVAARVLGVSTTTLDKWIARGRIQTIPGPGDTPRVALAPLVELVAEVQALRELGQTDGVLAAAILHLQQRDPAYRREFDDLYGESLHAAATEDLVPATVPETFGEDD